MNILEDFVNYVSSRGFKLSHRNTSATSAMTEVELTADEWKWVLKHLGNSFKGGSQPMTIADKKRLMKVQVITAEEIEFEKLDNEDEEDE